MVKLYTYAGPEAIAERAKSLNIERTHVQSAAIVADWIKREKPAETATYTYIVNQSGQLWISSRHSEHVACACGGPVQAAGEVTFGMEDGVVEAVYTSNQSTGFCPEPSCWPALAAALDDAGILRADGFELRCVFRRCECGQTNIVKDEVYECGVCQRPLPQHWNYDRAE